MNTIESAIADDAVSSRADGDLDLSPGARAWLDDHMASVQRKIQQRAQDLAKEAKEGVSGPVEPRFVSEAAKEYAPGTVIEPCPEAEDNWLRRVTSGITGVTLISALLALAFGALAILKIPGGGGAVGTQQGTLLDIAKLMAGAIIGSTIPAVAVGARRARGVP